MTQPHNTGGRDSCMEAARACAGQYFDGSYVPKDRFDRLVGIIATLQLRTGARGAACASPVRAADPRSGWASIRVPAATCWT